MTSINNSSGSSSSSSNDSEKRTVHLDGDSLTLNDLFQLSSGTCKLALTEESKQKIRNSRSVVDRYLHEHQVVYGITTGFGKFKNVRISDEQLSQLQENLVTSHAAGVGKVLDLPLIRRMLALRINVLAKGCSGVRLELVENLIEGFNKDVLSYVPEQGTVGASGDLAQLSHLALGFIGQGKMWTEKTGWVAATEALASVGMKPFSLSAKEGLSMINGTQFITALGTEALRRAANAALQADIIAAMTVDALFGSSRAYDERIHNVRPHSGQKAVAKRLTALMADSKIIKSHQECGRVQDAYSMRCVPQVHGIVHDTLGFVESLFCTEINSATENPLVFYDTEGGTVLSNGNFHGEYPAKACDYLATAVLELGNISERRMERMCNSDLSDGLPPFLVKSGGLNSGFMIAHCTAAALCSENKVLSHPASCDTISTSAGQEDHVSMGGFAARKALSVVTNVENILAIELLAATQALDFRKPLETSPALTAVYDLVRSVVPFYESDRYMSPDIESVAQLLQSNKVAEVVAPFLRN